MKPWIGYAIAAIVGLATAVLSLWLLRSTAVGSDPALAGAATVAGFAIVSGLLASATPRHWVAMALVVSGPLCVLGTVMFIAMAAVGAFFWVWLCVALGGVAASLAAAFIGAKARRA